MWLETKPDAVESSKLELLLTKFVQPSRPTPVKFGASAAASGETSGKPETPATESAEEPQPEPEKQKFRAIEPQDLMKFNVRLRDKHLAVRMHDPTLIGKGLLNMDSVIFFFVIKQIAKLIPRNFCEKVRLKNCKNCLSTKRVVR